MIKANKSRRLIRFVLYFYFPLFVYISLSSPLVKQIQYKTLTLYFLLDIWQIGKEYLPLVCSEDRRHLGKTQIKFCFSLGLHYLCSTRTPKPLNNAQIGGRFLYIPSLQYTMKLGKIKRITDLRTVWPHEANSFTKWLAQEANLSKLGEEIGIDLVLEERESSVGGFSVDIFATEESTGRKVIIENQLEDTDHDHLGKLITYASGKGAEVIIWVVKRGRDEHRQAIEWLNQHTDSNLGFFLVEIELWQIDDSAIAPKFSVIERPNDWGKQMKSITNLNDREQLLLSFWSNFNDYMSKNSEYIKHFTIRKAQAQHWYDLSVGNSSYHICMTASVQKKRLSCGIYIPDDKELFHLFEENKDIFFKAFNEEGDWKEAAKATRIMIYKSIDISDESLWQSAYDWFLENAIKFKQTAKKVDK